LRITAVVGFAVAVVTAFGDDVPDAIAAACGFTRARAGIRTNRVAIITGFVRIDAPVTADFGQAFQRTAITVLGVTIIAFFKAIVFGP
jgi:hypothetical protein